ncbi:MAG: serine/threonine protein kinase [Spirochaetes bacterium]|nr:serine/threonine protein kinase [Spirochaetota bacterium]
MGREKIGKYEIIEKIGQGGMGAVLKAKHPTLDRYIIIKQLTISKPNVIERFKREARIMLDLRDEHIVQVYDHFKEGKYFYIAMEYVNGLSLDELIDDKRYLSNEAAVIIFSEICKGLKHAHDKGIIHRDIKPANVLISKNGSVKLTDFGIATSKKEIESNLTREGSTLGSPAYMSPEQIYDTKKVDKRADIYSLGVTLYKMVTGKLPYPANISPETITMISKGKYVLPNKINPKIIPKIQKIITKCMKPKKSQRYKDVNEIIRTLKGSLVKYKKGNERENKKIINELIKNYIAGKEIEYIKIKVPFKKKIINTVIRFKFLFLFLFINFLALILMFFKTGYNHELFNSNSHGWYKLIVETKSFSNINSPEVIKSYIYWVDGKEKLVKEIKLHKNIKKNRNINNTFESYKIYLKSGLYKFDVNIQNEKHQNYFFVNPVSLIRTNKEKPLIKIIYDKIPVFSLKINFLFKNSIDNSGIDNVDKFVLYNNRWVNWDYFRSNYYNELLSGKKLIFLFNKQYFYEKRVEVYIAPYQNDYTVNVLLQPIAGTFLLRSKEKDLKILINNSKYFYDANKNNEYSRIQPSIFQILLNNLIYYSTGQEKGKYSKIQKTFFVNRDIALNPGNYLITIIKGNNKITKEFQIKSYQKITISTRYNKKNKKLTVDTY